MSLLVLDLQITKLINMKKIIVTAILLIGLGFSATAQEISKNAIGLRLGNNDGFGGEVSYQRRLSKNNRLELDLGMRNQTYRNSGYNYESRAVKLEALYQWIWQIDGGFNWYAGAGGGIGSYSNNVVNNYPTSGTFLLVAGEIGIEYLFDFPLQLSLDFRPEVGFGDYKYSNQNLNTFGPDLALGIRYRF
jgi:hypothetical protein